jgi:Ca-activated chloride channel family protein
VWTLRALSTVVFAALATVVAAQDPQQPAPVFRAATQTVAVYATVHDRAGRLVPDLRRDDFQILDRGRPADITVFSNDIQPLTVVLLLDMSGSMLDRFLRVREGTLRFIDALLPADRLRIGTFGLEIAISPILTNDQAVLGRIVREEVWPGGGTPMWNAMCAGMASLSSESGRRVVLVLTDGGDTGSLPGWKGGFGEVRTRAQEGSFMVYAVGMDTALESRLVGLTEDTGGGHFEATVRDDLTRTFLRVAEELRHQYMLGFTPLALDGKTHAIEVRSRPDLTVRARKTYVAK